MKIKKVITTTVDVVNAGDCYRPRSAVALEYLKEKYTGSRTPGGCCDSGCFISSITRIIKVGALRMDKTRNDGRMLMSVQFEAECYVFSRGEILASFIPDKFINIGEQKLPIGSVKIGDHCVGYANIEKVGMQAYKEGVEAPIIVKGVEYTISQPATISAIGFQPIYRNEIVYQCEAILLPKDLEYIKLRLSGLKDLIAALKFEGDRLRQFTYFKKMLSLAQVPIEPSESTQLDLGTILDVSSMMTQKTIYFTRPTTLEYGSTSLWFSHTERKDAISENFVTALDTILNQIVLELSSLDNMMSAYNVADLKQLKGYFDGYLALKKKQQ